MIQDPLFADDCALVAHSQDAVQQLFDRFAGSARRFGLTVSLKKTDVMLHPSDRKSCSIPINWAGDTVLKAVDRFCYIGSVLSSEASNDNDVSDRLSKASDAFGRLTKCLWNDHGIRLATKVALYKAVVLPTLLCGCESWTLYRRYISSSWISSICAASEGLLTLDGTT
jgi:hypothetical protein